MKIRKTTFWSMILVCSLVVSHFAFASSGVFFMPLSVIAHEQANVLEVKNSDMAVYFSVRQGAQDSQTHDIRFIVVVKDEFLDNKAKTKFKIEFYKDTQKITEHTPMLSRGGSEFLLYSSIYADGKQYVAQDGFCIYMSAVFNIPNGAWDNIDVLAELSSKTGYTSLGKIDYQTVLSAK